METLPEHPALCNRVARRALNARKRRIEADRVEAEDVTRAMAARRDEDVARRMRRYQALVDTAAQLGGEATPEGFAALVEATREHNAIRAAYREHNARARGVYRRRGFDVETGAPSLHVRVSPPPWPRRVARRVPRARQARVQRAAAPTPPAGADPPEPPAPSGGGSSSSNACGATAGALSCTLSKGHGGAWHVDERAGCARWRSKDVFRSGAPPLAGRRS